MAEYVKVVDLLDACVEVEYLGRPRMMVSASKIAQLPSIEIDDSEIEKQKAVEK